MLLHGERVVRAALHRRVVRDDHAGGPPDAADAGDDPRAGRLVVVHPERGERRELEERGARVEEPLDAIARQQLARGEVSLARALRSAEPRLREALAELRDERAHRFAVRLRRLAREVERGRHDRHGGDARSGRTRLRAAYHRCRMEDSRMDDSVRAAIARSFLADLPRPALERLLSGDVLGVAGAQGGPAPLHVQAITDARRVQFDVDTLRELARNDAAVAWVLMGELTRTVHALWHEIAATAFATVPQRVARHLLEIAAREQEAEGGALVANVSQQELADLAGTVREVVARALRELRDERIVRVRRSGITVLDPAALASRAWPGDADR